MIINFNKRTVKDDIKFLVNVILIFILLVWLCSPPGNKLLQMCFWGSNTRLLLAKLRNEDLDQYKFYRSNAVYLAKMYPHSKTKAINEINKAIAYFPPFGSESELQQLYKDRAQIQLYYGDYRAALSDYVRIKNYDINDYVKIALLYNEIGNHREALSYCNSVINIDATAYAGYACIAHVYNSAGRPDMSIKVWDLAIDRKPSNYLAYVDRAALKRQLGDIAGYRKDLNKAHEYSPTIREDYSFVYDVLHPKILNLPIKI